MPIKFALSPKGRQTHLRLRHTEFPRFRQMPLIISAPAYHLFTLLMIESIDDNFNFGFI